ncbi:MAG: Cro/Cl family transcriptional regulator [Nocardioides sp.]|nr:Cro/Cl family transcriptional regulator [Nocardioides sp.]
MDLADVYAAARRAREVARVRQVVALRAMLATGASQREAGRRLGVSQSAVSQQLSGARSLRDLDPALLVEAAGPVLTALAEEHGFGDVAVFGSTARGTAGPDSDVDLLVRSRGSASTFDLLRLRQTIEQVLDRPVDLVEADGLTAGLDDDVRRDARPVAT